MSLNSPSVISNPEFKFDSFSNGKIFEGKRPGRLPAMGWNSWNAFGSGNTEALTRAMADCIVRLGLDKLGYKYVVLDDGCYMSERVDGKLCNEPVKFPSGFRALADYVHSKGLKFGMYNDIGTNLCAGAAVGTCGHEDVDAACYLDWGVDFLKIDNCYYLWDNATFSNPENARYVFTPKIKNVIIDGKKLNAVSDGILTGVSVCVDENKEYVFGIGTLDGTNTGTSPVGIRSGELIFEVESDCDKTVDLQVEYATGREVGIGEWLQVAVESAAGVDYAYDDSLEPNTDKDTFVLSAPISISLRAGKNKIRIMNHRRQENTLDSYATMLMGLNKAKPDHNVLLSICEWGKTHPQNWAYKVGDSWRILNDISFRVGSDGNPGFGAWFDKGTPSVTSKYNKAVVMDEFAGLEKGWNDPDMLMIGMDGLNLIQYKTHFTMWCMMNSPLMLGLDLRRVSVGDELYKIIANSDLIALNQDPLGVQAKRIFTTADCGGLSADKAYIENIDRVDVLAKPLSDGCFALSFINVGEKDWDNPVSVSVEQIEKALGKSYAAGKYSVKDLWSGEAWENSNGVFEVTGLGACDCVVLKVGSV